jgi:CRISPR-associated endonuclease Cas2
MAENGVLAGVCVMAFWVMAYDISNESARGKVARRLQEAMSRVQGSVFEGELTMRAAYNLFDELQPLLGEDDSLRLYCLSANGLKKSRASGHLPMADAAGYWLF